MQGEFTGGEDECVVAGIVEVNMTAKEKQRDKMPEPFNGQSLEEYVKRLTEWAKNGKK